MFRASAIIVLSVRIHRFAHTDERAKCAEYIPIIGTIVGVGHLVYTLTQKIQGRGNCGFHALRSAVAITSCGAILIFFDLVAECRRKSNEAPESQSSGPARAFDTTNFPIFKGIKIVLIGDMCAKISLTGEGVGQETVELLKGLKQFIADKSFDIIIKGVRIERCTRFFRTKRTCDFTMLSEGISMEAFLISYGKSKLTPTT